MGVSGPGSAGSCAALLLLLCLTAATAESVSGVTGDAGSEGCHRRTASRRLLQAGNSTDPVIEMVEVDVVSQECVMINNAYYEVLPSQGVYEVLPPEDNLQDSARSCCASCTEVTRCNAFQWCPLLEGCPAGPSGQVFPHQGCQLMDLTDFLRGSVNTGQLKSEGTDVPFTAGSPLFFSVPKLAGYDVEIGRNFGGRFNYSCPGSAVEGSCVLLVSAQDLKTACDMDPKCMAFSFYPSGSAVWVTSEPFGVLKGGEGVQLTSADTELNPTAAIYFKLPQTEDEAAEAPPPGSDGGDGNNTTVIAAVLGSVVGAALVAGAVLLVFYLRSRKVKGLVADDQKDGPAEAGHEAHVTAGSGLGGGLDDGSIELALSGPGSGGSPLGGSGSTGGESGSSAGSPANSHLMAAGVAAAGYTHLDRTFSPLSVVDAASQLASGGSANPPEFSPFMLANPAALAAAARSRGSSSSSAYGLHQQQQQQHQQQHQQHQDAMVVEVQRASPAGGGLGLGGGSGGGGRGGLPTSMSGAGNARELLEVFARMYNQRPAVDYDVVAQMLDQDTDPRAVAEAESADEEQLRHIDFVAAQHRSASLSGAFAQLGGGGELVQQQQQYTASSSPQQYVEIAVTGGGQQLAAQQQQQGRGSVVVSAGGSDSALAEGDQDSLLPGMYGPPGSLLPPVTEWALQPEEIEICKRPDGSFWQLGTGAFGTCYKGLYHGRQLVAVKVLHRLEERRRGEEFEREVSLLKDLRDRNIVQFIGACLDGPTPMLVTEFMEFGDLWRALPLKNQAGQRIFAWHKRGRRVLYDVAKGLLYLHRRRIVHLDLKSANILLSRHGTAKICDIGMARVLGNKEYLSMLSGMGTFAWSAPEVLSGKRCSEKVDLYSFGVVIWEVCTGDVPVRGEMRPLVAPHDCPQPLVELYERCIAEHPEQRPTAAELLEGLEALL
ncbi:hypothetical protein D9Q98_009190 [Chlorella vulgaris]|uniref:Protein kinase domain-containing protein n=1 Tax=Chlorella vulgaris TaxID=3077 RepID=A0A9D4TNZ8_CHLVU|nr:hypothetical protein D9Q98_009190 [Chlorella vulgaris]